MEDAIQCSVPMIMTFHDSPRPGASVGLRARQGESPRILPRLLSSAHPPQPLPSRPDSVNDHLFHLAFPSRQHPLLPFPPLRSIVTALRWPASSLCSATLARASPPRLSPTRSSHSVLFCPLTTPSIPSPPKPSSPIRGTPNALCWCSREGGISRSMLRFRGKGTSSSRSSSGREAAF